MSGPLMAVIDLRGDRMTSEAADAIVGSTPSLTLHGDWQHSLGRVTVETASVDDETLTLGLALDEATAERVSTVVPGSPDEWRYGMGYTIRDSERLDDDGNRLLKAINVMTVAIGHQSSVLGRA